MRTVYLIDYSNFCYRFSSTFNRLSVNVKGIEVKTGILYGFYKALKTNVFSDIIICLDGTPQINTNLLPQYKGQRLKEPDENHSVSRLEIIKYLTKIGTILNKNVKVVASPLQEADQVMASITKQVTNQVDDFAVEMSSWETPDFSKDWRLQKFAKGATLHTIDLSQYDTVVLGTTDSDMYQLLSHPKVFIDSSTNGTSVQDGTNTPKAVFHLTPSQIPAYKSFVGDKSDNVPSIDTSGFDILDIIKRKFNSIEDLHNFIGAACSMNRNFYSEDSELSKLLCHVIDTNQGRALRINNKVTELVYLSTPVSFDYGDYSLDEAIKKYKIRI